MWAICFGWWVRFWFEGRYRDFDVDYILAICFVGNPDVGDIPALMQIIFSSIFRQYACFDVYYIPTLIPAICFSGNVDAVNMFIQKPWCGLYFCPDEVIFRFAGQYPDLDVDHIPSIFRQYVWLDAGNISSRMKRYFGLRADMFSLMQIICWFPSIPPDFRTVIWWFCTSFFYIIKDIMKLRSVLAALLAVLLDSNKTRISRAFNGKMKIDADEWRRMARAMGALIQLGKDSVSGEPKLEAVYPTEDVSEVLKELWYSDTSIRAIYLQGIISHSLSCTSLESRQRILLSRQQARRKADC